MTLDQAVPGGHQITAIRLAYSVFPLLAGHYLQHLCLALKQDGQIKPIRTNDGAKLRMTVAD